MTRPSRIWGEWQPAFFPSGTTIVRQDWAGKPHLYVYADAATTEDRSDRDRFDMCYQLAEFMNGGHRPAWLDDLDRQTETHAEALTGAKVFATGPMVDIDPPNLNWRLDESDQAKDDRARLMDILFLVHTI